MKRKKIIHKSGSIAGIIFFIAFVLLILSIPYRNWNYKKHQQKLEDHFSALIEENQNYLDEIAKTITKYPVDQLIIQELDSKYTQEHQRVNTIKKYLWMETQGAFIFGVPSFSFARLISAYDKYFDVIESDGYYRSRLDFLEKLINKYDQIDFSDFDNSSKTNFETNEWRYYNDQKPDQWWHSKVSWFVLKSPITDQTGNIIGTLYLKVDDTVNHEMYYSKYRLEKNDIYSVLEPILGVLLFLSGVFLWFLLPTWVYIDSQQRDVKNTGLWAFLALISGPFGLIIYLLTRPQTTKSLFCPQCEKELNGTKAFCPYCGFDVSKTFCPQCQYPIKSDWNFCPSCRTDLTQGRVDYPLLAETDPVKKNE